MRGEKKINKPIKINKHNGRLNSTGREGGRGGGGREGGREDMCTCQSHPPTDPT